MKERFIENGIEYVRNGDYYIPNVTVPDDKVYNIGKYGRMHAKFIKETKPCFYTAKMLGGTWLDYLEKVDNSTKEMLDRLIRKIVAKRGITEALKPGDQFVWISAIEQIKHMSEEFVLKEIVYTKFFKSTKTLKEQNSG